MSNGTDISIEGSTDFEYNFAYRPVGVGALSVNTGEQDFRRMFLRGGTNDTSPCFSEVRVDELREDDEGLIETDNLVLWEEGKPADTSVSAGREGVLSRREFLKLGVGVAGGVLGYAISNRFALAYSNEQQTQPPFYEIRWGAIEPLRITPNHSIWGPYYQYYVDQIKLLARQSPNFWTFLKWSVSYLNDVYRYYHDPTQSVPNLIQPSSRPLELMERIIDHRIMWCYEISYLSQYALKMGNGVMADFLILGWVADNFDGDYMIHSTLRVYVTAPGSRVRRPYILETTNGTIMPVIDYYGYLNEFYGCRQGIISAHIVPTGL